MRYNVIRNLPGTGFSLGLNPLSEPGSLGGVCGQREGTAVGCAGLVRVAQFAQQVCAGRVKEVVIVQRVGERIHVGHRIGPARVPRSRDRVDGGRLAACAERVRCVLLTNTHSPRPEQGCTRSPSGRAANGWPRDRDSAGWRVAPPLRTARCVVSSRSCRSSRWAARPTVCTPPSLQEASGDAVHCATQARRCGSMV
jgi:hypothetical protein